MVQEDTKILYVLTRANNAALNFETASKIIIFMIIFRFKCLETLSLTHFEIFYLHTAKSISDEDLFGKVFAREVRNDLHEAS